MDRTIDYIIGKEADGLRIAQFLRRKGYSRQNLATIKQMPDSTLVDGAPAYMNQYLRAGCRLTVRIRETGVSGKIVPVHLPLDIVYEDGDIVVVNKPAGMPIHPSVNNYTNTMANALAWYYKEQGKPFIFRCSNRLDRDTSGLTVVAKHLVSAGILSAMTADKTLGREYLAIVSGHVTPPAGTVRAPLARSGTSIVERKVDFEHGEEAVTHYETLGQYGPHSLVRLKLETGRTHQIRVHMQYLGFPLIGDYLYNPDMRYISRQALHSHRLSFPHPMTGEPMEFTAPLPEDMKRVLELA
ncbi:RluA family pseudouridine synthase [Mordavella massiliensis]|uniref:Pseudouridine synthase n=1 Tax=Mordavella massiliensis TaxID=1871024 RepID=A0A939BHC7_9CLOT|nr:RluA family pseudouridine synthase [Mordavella massiliensis]MBM6948641.1 RluA family pseudouridine synthase [Mordavella massiliensis]